MWKRKRERGRRKKEQELCEYMSYVRLDCPLRRSEYKQTKEIVYQTIVSIGRQVNSGIYVLCKQHEKKETDIAHVYRIYTERYFSNDFTY